MATASTNLSLVIPEATDATVVRTIYNANFETIDDIFDIVTLTEFAYLDGVTSAIQTQFAGKQASDAGLTSIAALTTAANKMIYTTASDTYAAIDLTAFGRSILDDADEATFKATVNLEIGTDVQAYDLHLTNIAALAKTDSSLIVGNGTTWVLESGDTLRTSLGLAIGTNVQAYDAQLADIAALAVTDGNIIVGDGTNWVAESGATALTSLGAAAVAQTMYIGTTQVAINRASAALTLAGITLTTPDIGVATATSVNKVTITAPATAATLTLVTGSSLITVGAFAVTLTSTAETGVTLPTTGTLATTAQLHTQNTDTDLDATFEATIAKHADKLSAFAATTSAELAGVISDETGTDKLVYNTSPVLITPTLGVASATSLTLTNPLAVTQGGTGITIATPAFQVIPTSAQTDIAATTVVTIVFGTEIFDVGNNFASNTFTAPITGKYSFQVYLTLENVDTAAAFYQLKLITSNRTYSITFDSTKFSADVTHYPITLNVIADMDASDTAYVIVYQSGGTAQTDISTNSWFSGVLVAI